jgi:hypothetical protein
MDKETLGRDDASIALERSSLRVSELATESRRRSCGMRDVIVIV